MSVPWDTIRVLHDEAPLWRWSAYGSAFLLAAALAEVTVLAPASPGSTGHVPMAPPIMTGAGSYTSPYPAAPPPAAPAVAPAAPPPPARISRPTGSPAARQTASPAQLTPLARPELEAIEMPAPTSGSAIRPQSRPELEQLTLPSDEGKVMRPRNFPFETPYASPNR